MKNIKISAIILSLVLLSSCAASNTENPSLSDTTESEIVVTEAPTAENATPAEESATPTEAPAQSNTGAEGMGGTDMCRVHSVGYHSYSSGLINYIGEDEFLQWALEDEESSEGNGCTSYGHSVYDLIHDFNIPREDFEEIYYLYGNNDVHNFDLLYGDDREAADAFYRNADELDEIYTKRSKLTHVKMEVYAAHKAEWEEAFGDARAKHISMQQIVNTLHIPRSELEEYIAETNRYDPTSYDYDLDALYGTGAAQLNSAGVANDPYPALAADAVFCGIDDYTLE